MAVKQRWMSRDTRRKSRYGLRLLGGVFGIALLSQAAAGRNVQRHLRKLACLSEVPAQAEEILNVERIREHGSHYALHCRVRRLDCRVIRRTYVLAKSMEDQERLLRQLERRERGVWP